MRSISGSSSAVRRVSSGLWGRGAGGGRVGVLAGLIGLAGLWGGCNPAKSPPSLPNMVTAPVTVPLPVAPTDATMFGYLRVDNLPGILKRVGGAQVAQLAAQRGLDLGELRAGAPLIAFVWDPQGATAEAAPVVVLAPIAPEGGLAGMLKLASPAVRTQAVGANRTSTAITLGDAAEQQARISGAALLTMAQTKAPFELTLFLNAEAIMAKYGPVLRAALATLGPMMALTAPQGPAVPSAKNTLAMFDQLVSNLEELKSFTVGSNVTDSALELSLVTEQKGGAKAQGPLVVPDLARFLPPGEVKLQWNVRDTKKLIDQSLRLYGSALSDNPQLKAQLDVVIADWLKAGRALQVATSLKLHGGQGLVLQGIVRVEDGPAAMAAVRRSVKLLSTGPVHDLYKQLGTDLQIVSTPNVRKFKGNPVDRYEYIVKPDADPPPTAPVPALPAQAIIDKLSGITYEVLQTGPYLIYSLGAPVESVAETLFTGQGPYPMAAMKTFPAGGSLYLELDLGQLWESLKAVAPATATTRLPSLPAQGSVVALWSYDNGPTSYQKAVIPTQLLESLAALSY